MIPVDVSFYRDNVDWPTKININIDEAIYTSETWDSPNYTSSLFTAATARTSNPDSVPRGVSHILRTTGLCHHAREFSRRQSRLLLLHNPFHFNSSCWG
jgi:hypothetical protein